jgi:hypothetical protein
MKMSKTRYDELREKLPASLPWAIRELIVASAVADIYSVARASDLGNVLGGYFETAKTKEERDREYVSRFSLPGEDEKHRAQQLSQRIAEGLAMQNIELDNLGDGESIVVLSKHDAVNLLQLAEYLLK